MDNGFAQSPNLENECTISKVLQQESKKQGKDMLQVSACLHIPIYKNVFCKDRRAADGWNKGCLTKRQHPQIFCLPQNTLPAT